MGRGWRIVVAVAVASTLIVGAALPGAAATGDRAMWIWDAPDGAIVDFAASRGVTDLYLHAPPGFSTDPGFAGFLAEAHAVDLTVHAMAGDPAWSKDRRAWTSWVEEVVAHGGFDGVVFDVEPYLHPDWGTGRQNRLIRTYLRGLRDAARTAGDLPVLAAVPFWFDEVIFRSDPLVERVLKRTDGIVVMAYRDRAEGVDGIIDLASTEADLAGAMGRDFVVGVETGPVSLDKVTFAEEGEAAMEAELAVVESAFGTLRGYGGIAIHHHGSYSTMAP